MLSACLATTLAEPTEERHAWQTEMVQWVGSALTDLKSSLVQKASDSQARLDEVSCEQNARQQALSESEEKLATLKDAFQHCESKEAEVASVLRVAEELLKDTGVAAAAMENEEAELVCLKSELEAAMAEGGSYTCWKSTAATTAEAHAFTSFMKKHDFEAGLVQSLPLVLVKSPAERSEFTLMVMRQFEVATEQMIAGLTEKQSSTTASLAEKAESVPAAEASLESADAELSSAQVALQDARGLVKQGEVAVKEGKRALKAVVSSIKEAQTTKKAVSATSMNFQEGPMATFEELDQRSATKISEIEKNEMETEHQTNEVQLPTEQQTNELQLPTEQQTNEGQ